MTGRSSPAVRPMQGRSVLDLLSGDAQSSYRGADRVGYELFGLKAHFDGDWKILWMPRPFGSGAWELYNLTEDPSELHDLSGEYPRKLEEMVALWEQYREDNAALDISLHLADKVHRESPTTAAALGDDDLKEVLEERTRFGNRRFRVHLDGYNFLPYIEGETEEWPRIDHPRWRLEHLFVLVPAQDIVGRFLMTFREYPPRQTPASFSIDQVMEKLKPATNWSGPADRDRSPAWEPADGRETLQPQALQVPG